MKRLSQDSYEITIDEYVNIKNNLIDDTVKNIKKALREEIYKGSFCPCCNSYIKSHTVELKAIVNSLRSLFQIVGNSTSQIVHKDRIYLNFKKKSNVIGKAKLWGLVTQHKAGEYSITEKGLKFCNGSIALPERIYVYNDKRIKPPIGEVIKNITYQQVLNRKKNNL